MIFGVNEMKELIQFFMGDGLFYFMVGLLFIALLGCLWNLFLIVELRRISKRIDDICWWFNNFVSVETRKNLSEKEEDKDES